MIIRHGFHLAQWQGFEKGKGISVPSLLRMCEVFDLKLEELVGEWESLIQVTILQPRLPSPSSPYVNRRRLLREEQGARPATQLRLLLPLPRIRALDIGSTDAGDLGVDDGDSLNRQGGSSAHSRLTDFRTSVIFVLDKKVPLIRDTCYASTAPNRSNSPLFPSSLAKIGAPNPMRKLSSLFCPKPAQRKLAVHVAFVFALLLLCRSPHTPARSLPASPMSRLFSPEQPPKRAA